MSLDSARRGETYTTSVWSSSVPSAALRDESVQAMQEGGEGLARAGGRGEEHVVAFGDDGPALGLDGRGLGEAPVEPRVYQGMEHAFSIASAASRLRLHPAWPEISGRDVA